VAADRGSRGKRKDIHERALGLLAVRQRSRRELERRLAQAGFEPDAVADELERLEQVGLLDDEAFARAVVESRMGFRGESRRVVAGLAQAGVASEIAWSRRPGSEPGGARPPPRGSRPRLSGLDRRSPCSGCTASSRRGYGPQVARTLRGGPCVGTVDD
jgi:regulatory protein